MGYTIYANGSAHSFDGGMGGFRSLRQNIAKAWDEEFGKHYETLAHCYSDKDYERFDAETSRILSQDRFEDNGGKANDQDVLEFLFASDCEGKISHRTCKKIYDLIKDIDFDGKIFTYAGHSDGNDYAKLKEFLCECYTHRRKLRWR